MIRSRDARPRRFAVVLALLLPLASSRSALAAADVVRIVVRTVVPLDDALFERTVGQVSDLPAEVRRAPDAALEPSLAGRLDGARALAASTDAAMVVWFEHPRDAGPIVFIALPSRERVLVRPVAASTDDVIARSTSAMLEAASLVVRNALLAFESGVALGVPSEELVRVESREPEPPRRGEPEPPGGGERPEPPRARTRAKRARGTPRPAEAPSWSPFVAAGWQLTVDGRSPAGARAGVLEGGVRRGAWSAMLRGTLGLPSRAHDELASLEVDRHSAALLVGRTLAQTSSVELGGFVGIGAVVFRRAAFARDASFSPAPVATRATAAGSLEVRLTWTPSRTLPIRLGFGAGADVLVRPPSFSYETARGIVDRPSWFIEPRIGFVAVLGR